MNGVQRKLNSSETDFTQFLRRKIKDLETDKKELVGVFGRSGAGKSSLINAIIGEKNLLPTGVIKACTSVMIKIESNTKSEYEAQIDFITKEEWIEEWWSYYEFCKNKSGHKTQEEDDDDIAEKLTAVYGEGWEDLENLQDDKHFREIIEFIVSEPKIIKHKTAEKLSEECEKFIKTETKQRENKGVKKWYWPLVKCVTLRIPNTDLLQDVTLVDLPGNGDRNKSRDKLWKEMVGSCSTVWIVTEVTRAASDRDAWEILENASSLMGNGGECQQIHFICTKSDYIENVTADEFDCQVLFFPKGISGYQLILFFLESANDIKEQVKDVFRRDEEINQHFSDGCFEVFTVSAKYSLEGKRLHPDVNEMWKLQNVLRNVTDHQSKVKHYVSGAHGILSLIDGARRGGMADNKKQVRLQLGLTLTDECMKIRSSMDKAFLEFEKCLNDGLEKSQKSCEERLKSAIYPKDSGSAFHKTLRSVVEKGGVHKPKKGKPINLNETLSSLLTESIDKEFRKTFPNERKKGAFDDAINKFSLGTNELTEKYKDLELQLIFLKTEEEKIKTKVNTNIRDLKKTIYHSLTETIEDRMKDAYDNAAQIKGTDSLKNMRDTLEDYVTISKAEMFREAKDTMLALLEDLQDQSVIDLEETMLNSVALSLRTDDTSIPGKEIRSNSNLLLKVLKTL
ncbi:nuclear GTPase SLIP-GC-like [Salarias fasciatus]|uniref:nuclear GTPase SLIP-GC-like n=1 Tax=Salarias fasciatus TaxID=181472 RepID=UPI001176E235|nr:nuclear GTPase SLIP-GC-like [Salarias fasciatus]